MNTHDIQLIPTLIDNTGKLLKARCMMAPGSSTPNPHLAFFGLIDNQSTSGLRTPREA